MSTLRVWYKPAPEQLGATVLEFLEILAGPVCLVIPGLDAGRSRFLVTLLHGNEPSGATALHRWLSSERDPPAVDIYCVIMNVEAALARPPFSFRQIPQTRDLNRCFRAPFEDAPGGLARSLLAMIHRVQPEALIDIHNTSGMGPSFGVAVYYDRKHDALVSLFAERLVITDLRLGALMELSERDVPTVTIECGGAQDPESHLIAYDGLMRYITAKQLFTDEHTAWPIDVLHNPVRLELDPGLVIAYAGQPQDDVDICLRADIENFNFGEVNADTELGWITASAWQLISVVNSRGENLRDDYLRCDGGRLYPATRLKLFMITLNPDIAVSDCLFYAVVPETALAAEKV
jgi:hypothetical protein